MGLLEDFGWTQENIIDLGDLTAARAMEMFVALWVRLNSALDRRLFGVAVVR
jgi:hypothetical protein